VFGEDVGATRHLWRDNQVPRQLDRGRIRGRGDIERVGAERGEEALDGEVDARTGRDLEGHVGGAREPRGAARDVAVGIVLRFADRLRREGERHGPSGAVGHQPPRPVSRDDA
jgi:hypothetical protein